MTGTLLLRLAAPRQSWGEVGTERFRPSSKIPTYSAIRGMLAACLGLRRGDTDPALDEVTLLVRVDRPGVPETDFHTVSPPPQDIAVARRHAYRVRNYDSTDGRADHLVPLGNGRPWEVGKGAARRPPTHLSERQYLADAEYILAVTGPADTVARLAMATHSPVFTPYLGRQAFAPGFPFHLGARDGTGLDVLTALPSTAPAGRPLRVHALSPGRPVQVARIDTPRTSTPLIDWKP